MPRRKPRCQSGSAARYLLHVTGSSLLDGLENTGHIQPQNAMLKKKQLKFRSYKDRSKLFMKKITGKFFNYCIILCFNIY